MGAQQSNTCQDTKWEAAPDAKSKMQSACCTSMCGIVLYFGMLFMVGWNEQKSVCTERSVLAAEEQLTLVKCDAKPEDHQGQLVFGSCAVNEASFQKWSPAAFGMDALKDLFQETGLRVEQEAEMLQCVETTKTTEEIVDTWTQGKQKKTVTTYTYNKMWKSSWIDSDKFGDSKAAKKAAQTGCGAHFTKNPSFPHTKASRSVSSLAAGSFDATRHLDSVPINTPIRLSRTVKESSWGLGSSGSKFESPKSQPPTKWTNSNTAVSDDALWTCQPNADEPIGCMRLRYKVSSTKHISFLAKLNADGTSQAWPAPISCGCPRSSGHNKVDYFAPQALSADEAIEELLAQNSAMKWMLRIGGILGACLGIYMFLQPIQAVADVVNDSMSWLKWIPLLGWGVNFLADVACGAVDYVLAIISLGVAVPTSLGVMGVMWFMMRPAAGIPMLVAGAVLLLVNVISMFSLAKDGRQKKGKKD